MSWLTQLGFWALLSFILASAVIVVAIRNLFRAALSLGLVLLGVAGLFVLLEAEFLAFVQILVYVGAILTLVVFAVMLTARAEAGVNSLGSQRQSVMPAVSRQRGPAAVVSVGLFILLATVTQRMAISSPAEPVGLAQLGKELITTLVLPFEVISLVFVAALVGAVIVASSNGGGDSGGARS